MVDIKDNIQEREEITLSRRKRLEIEQQAIDALLNMGVRFRVPIKLEIPKPKKRFGRIVPYEIKKDKRIPAKWEVTIEEIPDVESNSMKKVYMRHFQIKPLVLGAIDRIRSIYINIEYDIEKLENDPINESQRLFNYIDDMTEIVAVAIYNDREHSVDLNNQEVKELADFIKWNVTSKQLLKIVTIINQLIDPQNFTLSIRLLQGIQSSTAKLKDNPEKLIE